MRRHAVGIFLMVLWLMGTSMPALAATYEIDLVHSSVEFKIRHLVGRVTGSFEKFKGEIEFDESRMGLSSISVLIDVASINTRVEDRDKHLRSEDFFDAEKFPQASFVSKRVDEASQRIIGDFTLHGITREIELEFTYNGSMVDKWGNTRIGGSAQGVINRQDFGIAYDPAGVTIGNKVQIRLEIEGILKKQE